MDATSYVAETGDSLPERGQRGRGGGRRGRRGGASFAPPHRSRGERKRNRSTVTVDTRFYADGTPVPIAADTANAYEVTDTAVLVDDNTRTDGNASHTNRNKEGAHSEDNKDGTVAATVNSDGTTHSTVARKDALDDAGVTPAPVYKKEAKPSSDFALLRRALTDAESVAQYIRTYEAKHFSHVKVLMTFLQAISNRPRALYAEWMRAYRAEVVRVLDRLYAHVSIGKAQLTPYAHEFILRCEENGMRKASWADALQHTTAASPHETDAQEEQVLSASPLLSPRELLKKLAEADPVGRMQRRVEMTACVEEVACCAVKMSSCFARAMQASEEDGAGESGGGTASVFTYAVQSQLVSKLISKLRRLCGEACAGGGGGGVAAAVSTSTEEDADSKSSAMRADSASCEGGEGGGGVLMSAGRQGAVAPNEAAKMACREAMNAVLDVVEAVIVNRPASVTQQPIAKCVHLAMWCAERGMIHARDVTRVEELKTQANADMQKLATQLETVMELKTVTTSDGGVTLRERVQEMWDAGKQEYLFPYSVDVLSAIATAASSAGVEEKVREQIAEMFVQTQIRLRDKGVQLPRRVLRLVQSVRDAKKRASIAQQLSRERQGEK